MISSGNGGSVGQSIKLDASAWVKAKNIPEGIDTSSMPTELIHNVEIIDPFLGSVNSPKPSIPHLFPAFPAPKAIVERVFHDH